MKKLLFILTFSIISQCNFAQKTSDSIQIKKKKKFNYSALIIPSTLITLGFIGEQNDAIEAFNLEIQHEVTDNIDNKVSIDDFTQYAPFVSVYGLNALGIKGKHNFKDRTIILGTAYLTMGILVNGLKTTIHEQRPDGSAYNTFPSGHTATAFMGAEFLYQEYKHKSPWIGVSGYAVAALTGYYRMANNRHWFTDVLGGAGIGILSTKFAYWVHPFKKNSFQKQEKNLWNCNAFL